jgi:regulator of ribonuclease activity A
VLDVHHVSAVGGQRTFSGRVTTVRCFEDNALLKSVVEQPGYGQVLVVQGGGSLHRALIGDNITKIAADNGWAGVVIHGAVRDTAVLSGIPSASRHSARTPVRAPRPGRVTGMSR